LSSSSVTAVSVCLLFAVCLLGNCPADHGPSSTDLKEAAYRVIVSKQAERGGMGLQLNVPTIVFSVEESELNETAVSNVLLTSLLLCQSQVGLTMR
jgi:hypothetical protein